MKKLLCLCIALVMMCAFVGCGGGDDVTPEDLAVSSIAITTAPTKTAYKVGDSLDTTGMVVTATMEDDSKQVIATKDCTIIGFDSAVRAQSQAITVSYSRKTTTFNVSVEGEAEFVMAIDADEAMVATGQVPDLNRYVSATDGFGKALEVDFTYPEDVLDDSGKVTSAVGATFDVTAKQGDNTGTINVTVVEKVLDVLGLDSYLTDNFGMVTFDSASYLADVTKALVDAGTTVTVQDSDPEEVYESWDASNFVRTTFVVEASKDGVAFDDYTSTYTIANFPTINDSLVESLVGAVAEKELEGAFDYSVYAYASKYQDSFYTSTGPNAVRTYYDADFNDNTILNSPAYMISEGSVDFGDVKTTGALGITTFLEGYSNPEAGMSAGETGAWSVSSYAGFGEDEEGKPYEFGDDDALKSAYANGTMKDGLVTVTMDQVANQTEATEAGVAFEWWQTQYFAKFLPVTEAGLYSQTLTFVGEKEATIIINGTTYSFTAEDNYTIEVLFSGFLAVGDSFGLSVQFASTYSNDTATTYGDGVVTIEGMEF